MNDRQPCTNCLSRRGVNQFDGIPLCRVCARLYGTSNPPPTLTDINRNVALLFHALNLTPHNVDEEEEE